MQITSISKSLVAAVAMLSLGVSVHERVSAASSTTQNLVINATVTRSCTFDPIAKVSLSYDELTNGTNGPSPSALSTLSYTCSMNSAPTMSFGQGNNASSGSGYRSLANGGALLGYKLVQPTSSSCPTDGSGADIKANTPLTTLPSGNGSAQTLPICVELPSGQSPVAGMYTDTVVVTLTF